MSIKSEYEFIKVTAESGLALNCNLRLYLFSFIRSNKQQQQKVEANDRQMQLPRENILKIFINFQSGGGLAPITIRIPSSTVSLYKLHSIIIDIWLLSMA